MLHPVCAARSTAGAMAKRGFRYNLLTVLGDYSTFLAGAVRSRAWLGWGYLFLFSFLSPGASWDGLGTDVIVWILALVALFGLGRLSYAWASDD
jgi:hypothetical protein